MDDESGGLFNIEFDVSEESIDEAEKVPRDLQTEQEFQRQRKHWKPKIEVRKLSKTLKLPIDNPTKPQSQAILHAIEELYFFKMYREAQKLAGDVLKGKLNQCYRKTILDYMARCGAKLLGVQERNEDIEP